jgi:hypothetical protein
MVIGCRPSTLCFRPSRMWLRLYGPCLRGSSLYLCSSVLQPFLPETPCSTSSYRTQLLTINLCFSFNLLPSPHENSPICIRSTMRAITTEIVEKSRPNRRWSSLTVSRRGTRVLGTRLTEIASWNKGTRSSPISTRGGCWVRGVSINLDILYTCMTAR